MLRQDVLEKLVCFTDEEIDNLNGFNKIDKSIFTNEKSNIIDSNRLLFNDQQISVRKHARFCEYPYHRHNYIELVYVYGGKTVHHIDGKVITINEGQILLLNQNVMHSIDYCDENDIVFNFIIKPELLEFMSTIIEEKNDVTQFVSDILYSFHDFTKYLIFRPENIEYIKQEIELIITCIYSHKQINNLEVKLYVGLLLAKIMEQPENIDTYSEQGRESSLINLILNYIQLNYQSGSLDHIAKQVNIPNYTLSKIIKRITGLTFKQLLQKERLKIASQFLKKTDMPVFQVMEEIGYENTSYFYKIFKEEYSMTPNEYRDLCN